MARPVKAKLKNPLVIVGIVVAIALVGVAIYWLQKDEAAKNYKKYPFKVSDCKTFDGIKHCGSNYVGLTEDEAVSKAKKDGLTFRIVEVDGNKEIITDDIQQKRINFKIKQGKVQKAELY